MAFPLPVLFCSLVALALIQAVINLMYYSKCSNNILEEPKNRGYKPNLLQAKHKGDKADSLLLPGGVYPPRPFVKWHKKHNRSSILPCFPPDEGLDGWEVHREPTDRGFLFNKLKKVGSSTAGGINVRIAMNEAVRQNRNFTMCQGRWDHSTASVLKYHARDRNKSVLWTVIREPTKRAISHFFFFVVSKHKKLFPTDENFSNFLNSSFLNYYLRALDPAPNNQWLKNPAASVNNILSDYDFIGISERMDESAVTLMMLLDLNISDGLYLDSKSSGTYDDECSFIWPSFVSPYMKEYLNGSVWKQKTKWDTLLYRLANLTLDLTIDYLGRDDFKRNLESFRNGQAKVHELCKDREVFPCSSNGKPNPKGKDCLWKDSGCGNSCINEAVGILGMAR
jgi:hypothetical protein